ncbi:MAG: DNA topoisomerase IV [Bacteroidetes bacterium 4572_77]|nr:MAG: DNA topoisomerase IV [Bacteroidetes bacterium 4572_77]
MDDEYKDEIEGEDENTSFQDMEEDRGEMQVAMHLGGMYENWFLDYASYVILERAVPDVHDGLKPVHRRILHSMREMDDGRYNKVANIIGNTMKYHPHGDASIGDALVHIGQKDLLIDTQGNWGNILTGDRAAAPRYIEARLSKFALAVVFNPKTTIWKKSYDGRNREPLTLPVKFPLLLAQGVEGIAVGLASKILPHNFLELIDASIAVLRNKSFEIFPDFLTAGYIDVEKNNNGLRGGRLRVRAKIIQESPKLLKITEIPFSKNTTNLIESILSANEKGKIKIKKIDDNTAAEVEILLHLAPGVSPDQTIDALYAFTDCEISLSPNSCIIKNDKPLFLGVKEILQFSTEQTLRLLKLELQIQKAELLEQLHSLSLEKIFIEKRIYRDIEKCESFEEVIVAIDEGLKPYVKNFIREVTRDDIIRLTEIRIKRISKYNSFKADEQIKGLNEELEKVNFHLANLIDYAVDYFKDIKKRFGKGRGRKTEIRSFENINAATVAVANTRYYVNREDGFVGTTLKKDELVGQCSDIDDLIIFMADGTFMVSKVSQKTFVGKNIIHVEVFNKNDDRTTYNLIYRDGSRGNYYVKRFPVTSITRDRLYDLTKGTKASKVHYFSANPNGEAELLKIFLRPDPKLKKSSFEFDFKELSIKGRGAKGNIITKKTIKKIVVKESGVSTLGAIDIWYDETVRRLNTESRGKYLGAFKGEDKILTIMQSGDYQLYNFDIANHFDEHMLLIEKYDARKVLTAIYTESRSKMPYIKRFYVEESDKKQCFVGDEHGKLLDYSLDYLAQLKVDFKNTRERKNHSEIVDVDAFIGIKSFKAKGKRLTADKIKSLSWNEPKAYEYPPLKETEEEEIPSEIPMAEKKEEKLVLDETTLDLVKNTPKEEKPTRKKSAKRQIEASPKKEKAATVEFEIDMDDNHILIEKKKPKDSKSLTDSKKKDLKDDGQITLDFD